MLKKLLKTTPLFFIAILFFSLNAMAQEYIFTTTSPFIMPRSSSIEVVNYNHNLYTTESMDDIQHLIDAGIVNYCEPMSYSELFDYTTNDSYYNAQTNLSQISTQFAWNKGVFGEGVKIAVIDSGLYNAATEFPKANIIRAKDYTSTASSTITYCNDEIGHGTMVAGIIAAKHNAAGIAGIAPKATIYVYKCFYKNESGNTVGNNANILDAAFDAIDNYGVDIINLSSGTTSSTVFKALADYAEKKGVLIVSAVGNQGALSGDTLYYPASYDNVVGVGSVKADGHRADHSQRNDYVNIMAPGEDIYSVNIGEYKQSSGTSFACPHVTAAAALAKSLNPGLTNSQLMEVLYTTADAMADRYSGNGLLNIQHLMTYVKSTITPGKYVYSTKDKTEYGYLTAPEGYSIYNPIYEYEKGALSSAILSSVASYSGTISPNDKKVEDISNLMIWKKGSLKPYTATVESEEY